MGFSYVTSFIWLRNGSGGYAVALCPLRPLPPRTQRPRVTRVGKLRGPVPVVPYLTGWRPCLTKCHYSAAGKAAATAPVATRDNSVLRNCSEYLNKSGSWPNSNFQKQLC